MDLKSCLDLGGRERGDPTRVDAQSQRLDPKRHACKTLSTLHPDEHATRKVPLEQ